MDGATFSERVRDEHETALSRLGSDKALLAATDATLDADAVLGVLAGTIAAGQRRLADWANTADDPAIADALADGGDRLHALLDDHDELKPAEPATDFPDPLDDPDGDLSRAAAGLVGLPLVLDPLCLQAVNFFVNDADPATADALRTVRTEIADLHQTHRDTVADRATAATAEDAAVAAAGAVVAAAYATYVERLEAMGLDPKPIC